jgi:hypothetical protein
MKVNMKDISFFLLFICSVMLYDVESAQLKSKSLMNTNQNEQNFTINYNNLNTTLSHSKISLFNCSESLCNPKYGNCFNGTICICHQMYANFNEKESSKDFQICSYERKIQSVAFILELFVPFGTSYLYLGKTWMGLLKFTLLVLIPICYLFIICNCFKPGNNARANKVHSFLCSFLTVLYTMGILSWMATDLIFIALRFYKDNNGVDMMPW